MTPLNTLLGLIGLFILIYAFEGTAERCGFVKFQNQLKFTGGLTVMAILVDLIICAFYYIHI